MVVSDLNALYLRRGDERSVDLRQLRLELKCDYVPSEGMVYRHMRHTIEKLGMSGNTTRRTAVLAEQ